jgi:hypothetical protein
VDLVEYTTIGKNKLKIVGSDVTEMGNFRTPLPNKKQPTPSDIKRGQMHRFFIYKRNEPNRVFYEIDQDQVSTYKMKRDGINQVLYGLEEISWKLTGPEYDEYYNGILMAPGVVDTNSRIMLKMSNKFSIFTNIVNNPREYTVYDENFQ